MNNKLSCLVMFALGAAIGVGATFKYAKEKYEKIAQEEIESVKKVFSKKETELNGEINRAHKALEDNSKANAIANAEYKKKLEQFNYTKFSGTTETTKPVTVELPYVITPEEYGEFDDYNCISLTYYADGCLADDADELVDDIDEVVGEDSLTHFGEYEDDCVYVRNDAKKCDYEILLDQRNYTDVVGR